MPPDFLLLILFSLPPCPRIYLRSPTNHCRSITLLALYVQPDIYSCSRAATSTTGALSDRLVDLISGFILIETVQYNLGLCTDNTRPRAPLSIHSGSVIDILFLVWLQRGEEVL